jgi:hypothetical protein
MGDADGRLPNLYRRCGYDSTYRPDEPGSYSSQFDSGEFDVDRFDRQRRSDGL